MNIDSFLSALRRYAGNANYYISRTYSEPTQVNKLVKYIVEVWEVNTESKDLIATESIVAGKDLSEKQAAEKALEENIIYNLLTKHF